MNTPETLFILTLLAAACCSDLLTDCIPNSLVLTGLLGALCSLPFSSVTLTECMTGCLCSFCILYPLHRLGAMGAGDVKLLCVIAAFPGIHQTAALLLFFGIGSSLQAAAAALWRRRIRGRIHLSLAVAAGTVVMLSEMTGGSWFR